MQKTKSPLILQYVLLGKWEIGEEIYGNICKHTYLGKNRVYALSFHSLCSLQENFSRFLEGHSKLSFAFCSHSLSRWARTTLIMLRSVLCGGQSLTDSVSLYAFLYRYAFTVLAVCGRSLSWSHCPSDCFQVLHYLSKMYFSALIFHQFW